MRKIARLLFAVLLALAGAAVAVPAGATEGYCGLSWGSRDKVAVPMSAAPLSAVRTGRHACWDRLVFDLAGPAGGYSVGYVDSVHQDGSGAVLTVPGGARLQVALHHPAYDAAGAATYPRRAGQQAVDVAGYATLRSVVYGGSFEGVTTFGVGVRAHLPFRVFVLAGPGGHARIVVDVAHRWS
jgi:hypothetical protein